VKFAKPIMGEPEMNAVREVLRKAHKVPLTNGGRVRIFEEAFQMMVCGGQAIATSSCMAALHLAFMCLLKPGDEVIVPALTHPATAHAVALAGGRPVFCDAHPESGNLDPDQLPLLLSPKTKALAVVHFLGKPAYMMSCVDFARRHGLAIVEDCALALGAFHSGRHVGLIGDVGCFSFYPAKHMTTGEGGMLLTRSPELAEKAIRLRAFGYGNDRDAGIEEIGLNYRMTEIQGAIGLEQLKRLPGFLQKRLSNAEFLRDTLKSLGFNHILGRDYALSVVLDVDRDEVRKQMISVGFETSVYYPRPVPHHPVYKCSGEWPVAEMICRQSITLPVGPHLDHGHMKLQAETLAEIVNAHRARGRGGLHRPPSGPEIEGARA